MAVLYAVPCHSEHAVVILSEAKDLPSGSAMADYYVYIMASHAHAIYVGVTNDLRRRVYEHKHRLIPGFTSRYHVDQLVHFESTTDVRGAIAREKQIKGWVQAKKLALIESENPGWRDLSVDWKVDPSLRSG